MERGLRDLRELQDRLNPTITDLTQVIEHTEGLSLRVNHRKDGAVSVWQADRELSGTGTVGGLQRESATTGANHQTGEFDVALLDGGSGAGHSSQPSGMAQQVFPPGHATRKEDRRGYLLA